MERLCSRHQTSRRWSHLPQHLALPLSSNSTHHLCWSPLIAHFGQYQSKVKKSSVTSHTLNFRRGMWIFRAPCPRTDLNRDRNRHSRNPGHLSGSKYLDRRRQIYDRNSHLLKYNHASMSSHLWFHQLWEILGQMYFHLHPLPLLEVISNFDFSLLDLSDQLPRAVSR